MVVVTSVITVLVNPDMIVVVIMGVMQPDWEYTVTSAKVWFNGRS